MVFKPVGQKTLFEYAEICKREGRPVDVRFVGVSDGVATLVRHQVVELENVPGGMQRTGTYNS